MSNMVINTNILALNSHRAMKGVGITQYRASQRLSSGLRINSAADDAAGLAISEKMRAQMRGLDAASRNAQDAISLIQTAEGGMQEIDNMLQRIRELTVQATNDTNEHNNLGTGDRQKMQDEINQLVAEIDSMGNRVEFNKKKVIDGSFDNPTSPNPYYDKLKATTDADLSAALAAKANTQSLYDTALADEIAKRGAYNTALGALSTAAMGYYNSTNVALKNRADALKIVQDNASKAAKEANKTYFDKIDDMSALQQHAYDVGAPKIVGGVTAALNSITVVGGSLTSAVSNIRSSLNTAIGLFSGYDGTKFAPNGFDMSAFVPTTTFAADIDVNEAKINSYIGELKLKQIDAVADVTAVAFLDTMIAHAEAAKAARYYIDQNQIATNLQSEVDAYYGTGGGAITARTDVATVTKNFETSKTAFSVAEIAKNGSEPVIASALTALNNAKASYETAQQASDATNAKIAERSSQAAMLTSTGLAPGLYFQVGSNANQGLQMSIGSVKTNSLGIGDGDGNSTLNILKDTGSSISGLLNTLDTALSYVTTERSKLGAAQNRLEYTIRSLDISSENLAASESRIRDADMAKEMMSLTKSNVLQQAANSMLAQANQAPQSVLQLLR